MKKIVPTMILCGSFLAAGAAGAGNSKTSPLPSFDPPADSIDLTLILARLEEVDGKLKTLSADFRQFIRWDMSGVTQSVEGSVEYRKPDFLRLEHRLPEKQTLVADGTWLWVWRPAANQVIQTGLTEWKKAEPLTQGLLDFGNYAALVKRYDVSISSLSAAISDGHRDIELLLRPKRSLSARKEADRIADFSLLLRLSTKNFFPVDSEFRTGDIVAHSLFSNIRYNPEIPDSHFQFSPPPQADVFQNFKLPAGK